MKNPHVPPRLLTKAHAAAHHEHDCFPYSVVSLLACYASAGSMT
jgi:hypothetical protein